MDFKDNIIIRIKPQRLVSLLGHLRPLMLLSNLTFSSFTYNFIPCHKVIFWFLFVQIMFLRTVYNTDQDLELTRKVTRKRIDSHHIATRVHDPCATDSLRPKSVSRVTLLIQCSETNWYLNLSLNNTNWLLSS